MELETTRTEYERIQMEVALEEVAVQKTLMREITAARYEQGLSQKDLENISGVKQSVISKLEQGHTSHQLRTLLKLLLPLGKTIAIVPREKTEREGAE